MVIAAPTATAELWHYAGAWQQGAQSKLSDLKVLTAEVTLDETWAPYGQATVVIALPPMATLAALDPRVFGRRIKLTLGRATNPWTLGGGTTSRTFDFGLRTRTVDYVAGTVTLTACTDEVWLMDRIYIPPLSMHADRADMSWDAGLSVRYVLNEIFFMARIGTVRYESYSDEALISYSPGNPPLYDKPLGGTADAFHEGAVISAGEPYWNTVDSITSANGLRVWVNESTRGWNLTPVQATDSSGPIAAFDSDTTIFSATETLDIEEWADAAFYKFHWQKWVVDADANTATLTQKEGWDRYFPPTPQPWWQYDPYFTKGVVIEQSGKKAAGAAKRWVRRKQDRGRSLELTVLADFATTVPTRRFTAVLPDPAPAVAGVVSAVTWTHPDGLMRLTTRQTVLGSARAWAAQAEGYAWNAVPAGVSWQVYVSNDLVSWSSATVGQTWRQNPTGTAWTEFVT